MKQYNYNKVRANSLTKLLQIGQEPTPIQSSFSGCFDDQLNFYPDNFEYNCRLFPWEWILFPEIVDFAKQLGVEVPEDPPFDISRTF